MSSDSCGNSSPWLKSGLVALIVTLYCSMTHFHLLISVCTACQVGIDPTTCNTEVCIFALGCSSISQIKLNRQRLKCQVIHQIRNVAVFMSKNYTQWYARGFLPVHSRTSWLRKSTAIMSCWKNTKGQTQGNIDVVKWIIRFWQLTQT